MTNNSKKGDIRLRVKLSDEDQQRLCERYREGLSTQELSKEFGISVPTLNKVLDLNNVERRQPGRRKGSFSVDFTPELEKQVVKVYQTGASLPETAKVVSTDSQKVSVSAVRTILVKNAVEIRAPGRAKSETQQDA